MKRTLIIALSIFSFFTKSSCQVNLNNGLIAYYPFNGNANDVSGNGLNGNPQNGVQLTTDRFGNVNSAYHFDGIDDFIQVANNALLNPTSAMSIALYFNAEQHGTQTIIGKINFTQPIGTQFQMGIDYPLYPGVFFGVNPVGNGCIGLTNNGSYVNSVSDINLNQWYCVVATFDNGVMNMYLDGVLIKTVNAGFNLLNQCINADMQIGMWWTGDVQRFKGKIDDIRIYNRALNTDEVNALCNTPIPLNCSNWLLTPTPPSYVDIGDLDIAGNQITVEATINRTQPYSPGTGNNNDGDIVSKHLDPATTNYLLRPNHAYITTSNGYFATPDVCEIELNKTYHLAMVYDGTNLKYYRNGFLMSQVAASGNLFQNDLPARIGLYSGAILENFLGYTNEVRIWNVARSQQQIRDYMNGSLPNPATQSGLVAYYTFDDLLNKQGNPLWNGTMNGTASINQVNPTCSTFIIDSCSLTPCNISEDFIFKQDACNPLSMEFQSSATLATYDEIKWDFGDGHTLNANNNPVNVYSSQGTYDVEMIVIKGTCTDTVRKKISVAVITDNILISRDTTICPNASLQLQTKPALSFCWSPVTYLDNPNSPNPISTPSQNITYYYSAEIAGANLIANGDFSAGNSGFMSDYIYAASNNTEGQYSVGTNPQTWNNSLSPCPDHSSGSGRMMLVNGSPAVDVNVWKQTASITPNTNYAFSTWIQALWAPNPAQLQFSINGKTIGTVITASLPTCTWSQFYTTWNSGNNITADIAIVNKNTQVQGNDFALDDISFAPVTIMKDSVILTVDKPSVFASKDTTVCKGSPVILVASGASTYSWTPVAALNNPNIANPVANTVTSEQYIVTGTSVYGCKAKDTVNININNGPALTKMADTAICRNTSVQLSVQGGNAYSWTPASTLSNPSVFNPVASPIINTTYHVNATGSNGCNSTDSIKINIRPDPVFSISPSSDLCENNAIQLSSTGGTLYSWQPANTLNNASASNPVATPTNTTIYTVQINDIVCGNSASLSATITVIPSPVIVASKSNDIDCSIGYSQLNASGGSQYQWTPATTLSNAGIANPVATPVTPTQYLVKGTNAAGCSNTDSVLVDVKAINKGKFLMSSAFTPNNDGRNDCFGTKYWGFITDFDFSIFNRWGERVFNTKNISQCWDGTYKGAPQKADVYVYIIQAKSFCEETIFRKGTVALIR